VRARIAQPAIAPAGSARAPFSPAAALIEATQAAVTRSKDAYLVGCHNARTLLLGWVFRDGQAALWYSLISPLTVVWRLTPPVMLMASLGSCIGG
jgi:hypothetical protein